MSNNQKEQELLKGLALDDKTAIETIYKDNYGLIQNLVISNSGSEDDAKDVFQEALVVLYEKSKSGVFELNCQIRTYIYAVSKRLWLKRLQSMSRYDLIENGIEEAVTVDDDIAVHEKRNSQLVMMEHALAMMGEPCKSLLEAFYIRKHNMQEIADAFGYTNADNAKNQKYKCLMRLRKLFFAQYKSENING